MRVVPAIPPGGPPRRPLALIRMGFEMWRLRQIAARLAQANARGDADAARRWLARVDSALGNLDRAQDPLHSRRRPR